MQEKLILIRKKKNVSQKVLADLINVSINQYSLKEKGKYTFDGDEMFKIANYFKMNIEDIFVPSKHQKGVKKC